jgi:Transposase
VGGTCARYHEQAVADRYAGRGGRTTTCACVSPAKPPGRVDLLEGLVTVAIDEVKHTKGHRYLTVVCDHVSGNVIWAAKGSAPRHRRAFLDALGDPAASLEFVTAGGAARITDVVAEHAPRRDRLIGHVAQIRHN